MAFKKGDPKPPTSGRKKGSKPTAKSLRQGLADKGFDITQQFLEMYANAEDQALKFQILKEIAKHTQPPAPKEDIAIEVEEDKDPNATAQLIQLLRDPPKE